MWKKIIHVKKSHVKNIVKLHFYINKRNHRADASFCVLIIKETATIDACNQGVEIFIHAHIFKFLLL